ncbi:CRISPR system precrRNA processing endoribonuclease RAMP protein Cas6 [Geobacillus sp. C56-T2]|uniref:CRISPR system precrRNA processing endoribonuclease RAMP protein Cas6 n=1 Tax=Geobacillus sp. C56-T2 TaxID=600773 RepID=UPI0011A41756|nr:CRISPR system precrRNA processing endoribonuclease RAMP protein Cas6 [Geobacillus sp. C56-T2]NNV06824.1 CRISPR system precrRNA processing endoribonuclease RAMP protein Cas6 [Geobacillus sp. MMMUD3]TWG30828.1 uncharacterized protein DUF2276 [Geobacillus sp. C56-T2]
MNRETKVALSLPDFPYVLLRATLLCTKGGALPEYKSSAIRGVLARVIRKSVCHDESLACSRCVYRCQCVYAHLFDSPADEGERLGIGGTMPHPYLIRCEDRSTLVKEGQMVTVDIVLLGRRAVDFSLHWLCALEQIDRYSFGRQHVRFSLHDVRQRDESGRESMVFDRSRFSRPSVSFFRWQGVVDDYRAVVLRFRTPCRMMRKGNVLRQFSLSEFLWQLKQRVRQLYWLHGEHEIGLQRFDFLPEPPRETVRVHREQWEELARYSWRQQKKVWLGGIKVELEWERSAELDEWLPLLLFGEKFHVGKATTFGLGQYELLIR